MNILYLGDIMGKAGRTVVAENLPKLREDYAIDFVIAQGENVSHGKSMVPRHMEELLAVGVDFFSGGDHSLERPQLYEALNDDNRPVIRPANMIDETEGKGHKIVTTEHGDILVISLLGSIFPEKHRIKNPLIAVDEILDQYGDRAFAATFVNLHGDYSSEKRVMGYYLDGRVTAVVGDHWHVQSADAMILPKGTAHITDVGMCGSLHSSLGIEIDSIIPRWRDGESTKKVMALDRPYQMNGLLVKNIKDGTAQDVERISLIK